MYEYAIVDSHTLDVEEVSDLYRRSTLAERRPVDDRDRFTAMIRNANLVVVARSGGTLIGISRSITDWSYTTYLSDLAVDAEHQRSGVGRELIDRTRRAAAAAKIVLLSAPAAAEYYPHIGFTQHHSAWVLNPL